MKVKYLLPLAVLSIGALAACGPAANEGGAAGGEKLMIWAAAQEKAVVKHVIDTYNATASAEDKIAYNLLEVEEPNAADDFSKDPTAKNRPDLFLTADDKLLGLKSKSLIWEVKGEYKTRVIENNSSVAVANSSIGDKLFGFPISADNGYFLYYDKTVISDEDAKSLNTILEKCTAQNKKMYFDISNGYYAPTFLSSPTVCGLDSIKMKLNDAGDKLSYNATWDSAKGIETAKAVNALLEPAYNQGEGVLLNGKDDQINTLMGNKNHDMVACITGIWKQAALQESLGENLGAAKLPTFKVGEEEHQMVSFAGSKVWCINNASSTAMKKEAVKVAELLTNKEAQLKRFEVRKINPCNNEAAADPTYKANMTIGNKAFMAQAPYSIPQGASVQERYWGVGEAVGKAFLNGVTEKDAQDHVLTWETFLHSKMDLLKAEKAL